MKCYKYTPNTHRHLWPDTQLSGGWVEPNNRSFAVDCCLHCIFRQIHWFQPTVSPQYSFHRDSRNIRKVAPHCVGVGCFWGTRKVKTPSPNTKNVHIYVSEHTEAVTKWREFLNHHFQIHFTPGILTKISLTFLCKGPIANQAAWIQVKVFCMFSDKLLPDPMMICLLTYICLYVSPPQCVKFDVLYLNCLVCGYIPKYIRLVRFGLIPWKSSK